MFFLQKTLHQLLHDSSIIFPYLDLSRMSPLQPMGTACGPWSNPSLSWWMCFKGRKGIVECCCLWRAQGCEAHSGAVVPLTIHIALSLDQPFGFSPGPYPSLWPSTGPLSTGIQHLPRGIPRVACWVPQAVSSKVLAAISSRWRCSFKVSLSYCLLASKCSNLHKDVWQQKSQSNRFRVYKVLIRLGSWAMDSCLFRVFTDGQVRLTLHIFALYFLQNGG